MFWENLGGTVANLLWVVLGILVGFFGRGIWEKYIALPKK